MVTLLAFTGGLLWLLYRDRKEEPSTSTALWIVILWAVIYGSRPVTEWFSVSTAEAIRPGSIDEGNPIEALVSLLLIALSLVVLLRRGVRWTLLFRQNAWLFALYLFWLLSVSWSDYPLITFKRLAKDFGNILMVLVILTDSVPHAAMKVVGRRVTYLLVPLSILFIRYYPEWGRAYIGYDQSEVMWVGVATHKNTLGVLACVGALFLLSDLLDLWSGKRMAAWRSMMLVRSTVLLMCWYLLLIANSATSLVCAAVGSMMLVMLSQGAVRNHLGRVEFVSLTGLLTAAALDSVFNVRELVLTALGRDMTLTTRTDVWPTLIAYQDSPILGTGFNTFWAGQRLVHLQREVATIIQAHNGYLETYLNGGLIGAALLLLLLLSAYLRVRKMVVADMENASIRFVFLVVAVVYNNTEASFNKMGLMWMVTLFAILEYGSLRRGRASVERVRDAQFGHQHNLPQYT